MEEEGSVVTVEELGEEGPHWPPRVRLLVVCAIAEGEAVERRQSHRSTALTEPTEHACATQPTAAAADPLRLAAVGHHGCPPELEADGARRGARPAELTSAAEGAKELALASALEGREQEPPPGAWSLRGRRWREQEPKLLQCMRRSSSTQAWGRKEGAATAPSGEKLGTRPGSEISPRHPTRREGRLLVPCSAIQLAGLTVVVPSLRPHQLELGGGNPTADPRLVTRAAAALTWLQNSRGLSPRWTSEWGKKKGSAGGYLLIFQQARLFWT
jgi:hypothetical protein